MKWSVGIGQLKLHQANSRVSTGSTRSSNHISLELHHVLEKDPLDRVGLHLLYLGKRQGSDAHSGSEQTVYLIKSDVKNFFKKQETLAYLRPKYILIGMHIYVLFYSHYSNLGKDY